MSTQTASTLNDVIETLKDGQEGFRTAAEDVQSLELKELFSSYSVQRQEFAVELQTLARAAGDADPVNSGSVAGALHRGWINLKSALASRDEHTILSECERGEDSAVAAYQAALEDGDVAQDARLVLLKQSVEIKAAHDRIKALRDATKKS